MNRTYFGVILAGAVLTVPVAATVGVTAQPAAAVRPAPTVGAGSIPLTWAVVNPEWPLAMFAFIETGSDSDKCLVTLQNSTDPWKIRTVYCTPYVVNGKNGVQVTVLFDQPGVGPEIFVGITLYQERAKGYGPPMYWPY